MGEGKGSMNFSVAYDKVMAKWPADREEISVRTAFGETVVNVCGPRDGARSSCCRAEAAPPRPPGSPTRPNSPVRTGSTPST